jgi:hypothetical protein
VATAYRKHRLSPEAHRALALLGRNSRGVTEALYLEGSCRCAQQCFQQVSSFGDWLNHTHSLSLAVIMEGWKGSKSVIIERRRPAPFRVRSRTLSAGSAT